MGTRRLSRRVDALPYRRMVELAGACSDRTRYSMLGMDMHEVRKLEGERVTLRLAARVVFNTDPWQAKRLLADAIATRARDAGRPGDAL